MTVSKRLFGETKRKAVYEYTLENRNGMQVSCLDYGCAITKIVTPDRNGVFANVVLGFSDLAGYQENAIYAGVVLGRVAGRIKGAQFELEGVRYDLAANDGANHLHGGEKGFHKALWDAKVVQEEAGDSIEFSHISLDKEDGYPGTLQMKVRYTLTERNELIIRYRGETDKPTLLNPTNHSYFNLSGDLKDEIGQHVLTLDSSCYLELTDDLLPTGTRSDVSGSVFDFRNGRSIADGLNDKDERNRKVGSGYDHPFILDSHNNGEIKLYDAASGRKLTIETDAPSVVLYTGNYIPEGLAVSGGKTRRYAGLCLETQGFPDAIHHEEFPSCVLTKDQVFSTMTKYAFGVEKA